MFSGPAINMRNTGLIMRTFSCVAGAACVLLAGCVTINIYFPAAAAEKAARIAVDVLIAEPSAAGDWLPGDSLEALAVSPFPRNVESPGTSIRPDIAAAQASQNHVLTKRLIPATRMHVLCRAKYFAESSIFCGANIKIRKIWIVGPWSWG